MEESMLLLQRLGNRLFGCRGSWRNWVRISRIIGCIVIITVPSYSKEPNLHSKTKHIQLKYHFIISILEDELLKLEKIHTSQNPPDMLTKVVTREKLSSYSVSVVLLA